MEKCRVISRYFIYISRLLIVSKTSAWCLAEVNVESLAEFRRVVRLRPIEVDPEGEGEEAGGDGAGRG